METETKRIWSHGTWMTEKEDARACDMVDAIQQGDHD